MERIRHYLFGQAVLGAIGFLSKPIDEQDLTDAIQKGHAEWDRRLQKDIEGDESRHLLAPFTDRETEMLERIAKGLTTWQIAWSLNLAPRMVDSHRASSAAKAGTTSAAELTRLWLESQDTP